MFLDDERGARVCCGSRSRSRSHNQNDEIAAVAWKSIRGENLDKSGYKFGALDKPEAL